MELICPNYLCNSSSSLLSPLIIQPEAHSLSKLNFRARNNNRSVTRIQAQNGNSLVQLDRQSLSASSNSALEQLDIERGVCVPFRKYTPESVCNGILLPQ